MAGEGRQPSWVRVTEQAGWVPRDSCGELVYDGRMWLFGGWLDMYMPGPRDVWSSVDGVTWELVTPEAPWRHGDIPTPLVFDGRMWTMGGWQGARLPDASASHQVWCSSDGVTWTLATRQALWAPRAFHRAVSFAGKLWFFGGGNYLPDYAAHHDVWCSADGITWQQVTAAAPWPPRIWFRAVVYRDLLWVLGGWSNHPSRNWNDVWYTADGRHWSELKTEASWSPRHEMSVFVHQDALWVAGGMEYPLVNDVWRLELPEGWPG